MSCAKYVELLFDIIYLKYNNTNSGPLKLTANIILAKLCEGCLGFDVPKVGMCVHQKLGCNPTGGVNKINH